MKVDFKQQVGGYIAIRAWTNSDVEDVQFATIKIDEEFIRMVKTAILITKTTECKSLWNASVSFGVSNLYFFNTEDIEVSDLIEKFDFIPVGIQDEDGDKDMLATEASKVVVSDEGCITLSAYGKNTGAEFFATVRFDDIVKRII